MLLQLTAVDRATGGAEDPSVGKSDMDRMSRGRGMAALAAETAPPGREEAQLPPGVADFLAGVAVVGSSAAAVSVEAKEKGLRWVAAAVTVGVPQPPLAADRRPPVTWVQEPSASVAVAVAEE